MWSKFLKEWNGVSFFVNDDIVNAADIQLFTDATMTSFGGYYMYQWFQGEFPVEILDEQTSMAFFLTLSDSYGMRIMGSSVDKKTNFT
jgi:hypothetical protein